ncbi:AtpZ/AtpI family protein [Campylobacter sp. MG1]|uniref:AtpZ/AtpI family protein n=1 Tax=Campylobacter sp. MG1 TaxID=2976332 RepID=UPI00226C9409|nr:AtpZ/AtpI family protein [Campylobacter sp. MG1]
MHNNEPSKKSKQLKTIIEAANHLSLGISIVVAILIGIGIGVLLAKIYKPLFFFGLLLGVSAAILNVYKAYKLIIKINSVDDKKNDEKSN